MPEIFSSTNDGVASYFAVDTWANARSAATGTGANNTATNDSTGAAAKLVSGRGSVVAQISRAFFEFDTSGITEAPTSATLKIFGNGVFAAEADVIVVRSTQDASLSSNDFDALHNSSTELGNSDGSGGGSLASVSGLNYSSVFSGGSWSTSGYNTITLNSTALSMMVSLSTFKVALLNYDYDYLDVASVGSSPFQANGMYFKNYTDITRHPKIDYVEAVDPIAVNPININGGLIVKGGNFKIK